MGDRRRAPSPPARDERTGVPISGRRRWAALGALAMISLLLLLQDTAVSVALPAIGRDLGLSLGGLEWVVNAFSVAVAALTLAAGRLADAHGRRRMFLLGVAVFGAGSLLAGFAAQGSIMIAARAVQGGGAALAGPAALAIIWSMFGPGERGTAVGLWAGAASLGLGLGPIIGALLSQGLGWRAIFLVNVPLVALALIAARLAIPESRDPEAPRGLPGPSVVTSAGAIITLLLALTRAPTAGWLSAGTLMLFTAAAVCVVLFVASERRSRLPLLDRTQLRRRGIVGANVVSLLSTAVMCNLFFFLSLYFQTVRGLTSLGAAGMLLPLTGMIVVFSPLAGRASDRIGRRPFVIVGLLTLATALGLLSRIGTLTPLALILVALAVTGAGIGLATPPITAAALDGIPEEQAGQASAVLNTSRALGLSLGIAVMGALLSASPADVVRGTTTTRQAFVDGLTLGLALNAGIALLAAGIALHTLAAGRRPGPGRPADEDGVAMAVSPDAGLRSVALVGDGKVLVADGTARATPGGSG